MACKRYHMVISGTVQGVWYRASTKTEASRLGLTGYVRNLPDGGVEVVAEGETDRLEQLKLWCHQGPPRARVKSVELHQQEATGEFTAFGVWRHH